MEKSWNIFGMAVLATLIGIGIYFILSPKHVVQYSLDSDYTSGVPRIHIDIDNSSDNSINLSKDVTWDQAIHMIDSLNAGLRKNPIR